MSFYSKVYVCQLCAKKVIIDASLGYSNVEVCPYCNGNAIIFTEIIELVDKEEIGKIINEYKRSQNILPIKQINDIEQKFDEKERVILDIIKHGRGLKLLCDDGYVRPVDNLLVHKYEKEYNFGELVEQSVQKTVAYNLRYIQDTKQMTNKASGLLKKIVSEVDIKYSYDIQLAYYDIETVENNEQLKNSVPEYKSQTSRIKMIQYKIQGQKPVVLLLDCQYHEIADLSNIVEIRRYTNEQVMVTDFIDIIRAQNKQTIWLGFNASAQPQFNNNEDVNYNRWYGYDLAWIVNRGLYQLSPLNKKLKVNDRYFLATCKIEQIPLAYFYDVQLMCYGGLQPKDMRIIKSYSLQSYAEIFGFSKQEDHSYIDMRERFITFGGDITEDITYGIQDIEVLEQIQGKLGWLLDQKEYMDIYKLGLYMTLYETHQNRIQVLLNRRMIEQNRAPAYYIQKSDEKQSYKGADTGVDMDYACKVMSDVIQNDFSSLYPSVIIYYNISPETIIMGGNEINVNFNTDITEQEFVSFDKSQMGILPALCKQMLEERAHYKQEQKKYQKGTIEYAIIDKKQLSRKLIANTIYGQQGAKFSPQFNIYIAKAITAGSRMALNTLKEISTEMGYKVIAWDTDAVNFPTNIPDITFDQAQDINKQINEKLHNYFGNDRLSVTCEEIFRKVVFAKAKKSYARLEVNAYGQESIVAKGIAWACINPALHKNIENDVRKLLTDQTCNLENMRIDYIQELQQAVSDYNLEYIYNWGQVQKSSANTAVVQYIKDRLGGLQVDKINIFYTKRTYQNNKTSSAIIFDEICRENIHLIDVNMHVDMYIRQLEKIFSYDKQKALKQAILDMDLMGDSDKIMIRSEQIRGGKTKRLMEAIPIDMIRNEIKNNPKISYHEIITGDSCRLFFDIDTKHVEDPVQYIGNKLTDLGYSQFQLFYATAHSETKRSWHIVSNLWMHKSQILGIYNMINSDFDNKDFIDIQPAKNSTGSLRLPETIKIDDNKIVNRKFKIMRGTFNDMLITNNKDVILIVPTPCSLKKYNILPQYQQIQDEIDNPLSNDEINHIEKYINNKLPAFDQKQQLIALENINCPLRPTNKKNHGCYLLIQQDNVQIRCHNPQCKGISIIENRKKEEQKQAEKKTLDQYQLPKQIYTQNNRYVQYQINQTITAVQSHLGTGKTEQLIQHLKNSDDNCVILSTRIAYAQNVKQRFNNSGIEAISYKDQKGVLVPESKKPIIVQFESLQRICDNTHIDLLVLDEWLSILEQIQANLGRHQQQIIQYLYELINRANKVLILDGLLTPNSIQIIEYIKKSNALYINNKYSPYNDYTVDFYQSNGKQSFAQYKKQLVENVKAGKKVVAFITEKQKLYQVIATLQEYTESIKYVTGDDLSDDKVNTGEKHFVQKYKILDNFEEQLQDCQVFLFTSAITSGVDFSLEHFDIGIHYAKYNSCTPNQCIQALFRVRNLADKKHILYYQHANLKHQYIPYYMLDTELHQHIPSNIKTIAESFMRQTQWLGELYVYQSLKQIGLWVNIGDINYAGKVETQSAIKKSNRYLYGEDIPDELEQYVQAQQNDKQIMIKNGELNGITEADIKIKELYQYKQFVRCAGLLDIDYVDFMKQNSELSFAQIDKLVADMQSYIRLKKVKDSEVYDLKKQDIVGYYKNVLAQIKNAVKEGQYGKKSIDDIKQQQINDIALHEKLMQGEYHPIFNQYPDITPDIVKSIKKKCKQIGRPKDSDALCKKLNIPDLKVNTIMKNIKVLYEHFYPNNQTQ